MKTNAFTAVLEREGDGFVALCPELDVASQGGSVEEAVSNLREAVELFLECASPQEIEERLHSEVFVTRREHSIFEDSMIRKGSSLSYLRKLRPERISNTQISNHRGRRPH